MTKINLTTQNHQYPIPTGESHPTSLWNNPIKNAISQLANFVFSGLYAVYDFPRSINPVTQQREFRWTPISVEKAIGTVLYPIKLQQSGMVIRETDKEFGKYSLLVHEIGRELVRQCPRKDLEFQFEVVKNDEDNAWSLPGGKIAINLRLITNMEEEESTFEMERPFTLKEKIAAVLSHEIIHVAARHGSQGIEFTCFLVFIFKIIELTISFFLCKYFDDEIRELETINDNSKKIANLHGRGRSISFAVFTFFDIIAYRWILAHCTLHNNRSNELEADKYGMHLIHKVGSENNTQGFTKNSAESAVWVANYCQKFHSRPSTGWLYRIINLFYRHPTPAERLAANIITWQELQNSNPE